MITKKANKQTFAWDPSAFQGKGYWFILGKNGAYGRAASKAESVVLGKPKDTEEPEETTDTPVEPTQQKEPSSDTQEKLGKMVKKFDFKTIGKILNKIKAIKPSSILGGKKEPAGVKPVIEKSLGNVNTSFYNSVENDVATKSPKNESAIKITNKIYKMAQEFYEKRKTNIELENNFQEEMIEEDGIRHKELIDTIIDKKGKEKYQLEVDARINENKKILVNSLDELNEALKTVVKPTPKSSTTTPPAGPSTSPAPSTPPTSTPASPAPAAAPKPTASSAPSASTTPTPSSGTSRALKIATAAVPAISSKSGI